MYRSTAYGLSVEDLNVVVVEDSRPMQEVLRSILSALRVDRYRVFSNADEALKSMSMDPPNMIMSDWRMQPLSGYNMLKIIRHKSMSPLCFVPVLMLTGYATHTVVDKAFRAGAHQFLVKPISPTAVLQRIEMILQDDRRFRLEKDHYVIDGVDEELDKAEASSSLARQRHLEKLVEFRQIKRAEKKAEKAPEKTAVEQVIDEASRRKMNALNYRNGGRAPSEAKNWGRPELPSRKNAVGFATGNAVPVVDPLENFKEL